MKTTYQNITSWLPIANYKNNMIFLKNNKVVNVYKVAPINFNLKTNEEKIQILRNFQNGLKTIITSMQVVIQTDRKNLHNHFVNLDLVKNEKSYLSDMIEDYINFVKQIMRQRESVIKKYYLVLPNSIEESNLCFLNESGNIVTKLSENELEEMLSRCFQRSTAIRKDMRWV